MSIANENEPVIEAELSNDVVAEVHRLPATTGGLTRKSLGHRSLIDHVDELFETLYNSSSDFRALVEAVFDAEAVEGSMRADDYMAAKMIRDNAPEGSPVGEKNLEAISRALRRVLTRWNISRRDRREGYEAIES